MDMLCPCGSKIPSNNCCSPIIDGNKDASTAEELMRSRYVAFTQANVEYLMFSHHSKTRQLKEKKNIERWAKSVQWMGLVIQNTNAGTVEDSIGYVEFRAIYLEDGKLQEIHENSYFEMENGKWVYVSGVHL